MLYTITYKTSVGALTAHAFRLEDALVKAHTLELEGCTDIEIIDPQGHRHEIEALEAEGGRLTRH